VISSAACVNDRATVETRSGSPLLEATTQSQTVRPRHSRDKELRQSSHNYSIQRNSSS